MRPWRTDIQRTIARLRSSNPAVDVAPRVAGPSWLYDSRRKSGRVISVSPMLPPLHVVRVLSAQAMVDVLAHSSGEQLLLSWQARRGTQLPDTLKPWSVQLVRNAFRSRRGGAVTYAVLIDDESLPIVSRHAAEKAGDWSAVSLGTNSELLAFVDFVAGVAVLSATVFFREFGELRRYGAISNEAVVLSYGLEPQSPHET
jgi:hypothetical protein